MSEAQLVFLLIVPMSSESWYVRVQTTPYIHGPTGNHGKKLNAALWWNAGWNRFVFLFFLERNELKQKEREVIVYIYSVLFVSSRGTMQKQLAAEWNRGSSTI